MAVVNVSRDTSDVSRDTYRRLTEEVYKKWKPENLYKVPDLLEKYRGLERDVFDKAVNMYAFSQPRDVWRPLIAGMYQRFKPGKLSVLDDLLDNKYKENPALLYQSLCLKYIPRLRAEDPPLELMHKTNGVSVTKSDLPMTNCNVSAPATALHKDAKAVGGDQGGDTGNANAETIRSRDEVKSDARLETVKEGDDQHSGKDVKSRGVASVEVSNEATKDSGQTSMVEAGGSNRAAMELPAESITTSCGAAPEKSQVGDAFDTHDGQTGVPSSDVVAAHASDASGHGSAAVVTGRLVASSHSQPLSTDARGELAGRAVTSCADTQVAEARAEAVSGAKSPSPLSRWQAPRRGARSRSREAAKRDREDGSPRPQAGGSCGSNFESGSQPARIVPTIQRSNRNGRDVRDVRANRDVRDVRHGSGGERRVNVPEKDRRGGSGGGDDINSWRKSYRSRTRSRSQRRNRDLDPRSREDRERTNGWHSKRYDDDRGQRRGSERERPRRVELKARPPSPVLAATCEASGSGGKRRDYRDSRSRSSRIGRYRKAELKAAPIRPTDATTPPSQSHRPTGVTSLTSTRRSPNSFRGYDRRGGQGDPSGDNVCRENDRDRRRDRRRRDGDPGGSSVVEPGMCGLAAGSSVGEKRHRTRSGKREQDRCRAVDDRNMDMRDRDKPQKGSSSGLKHSVPARQSPGARRSGGSRDREMTRRREDTPVASRKRTANSSDGTETKATSTKAEAPLVEDGARGADSFLVGRALRAFMAATPRVSMDTGEVPKLLQASVEHENQQLQFTLANTTTLGEVAHMYGQWLRTLRADR
eukprot:TRINITY_DN3596_c0_g2_i1.p1 TRINITY_DN3596_c0_g2~~TRINITY_DN3596_c0_g2_i1.p1  ORF type:complete len:814 (-),score=122.01 TRINITY_DN3596_c0_g2_i1:176-2617(-)